MLQVWVKGGNPGGEIHSRILNPEDCKVTKYDWTGPTLVSGYWRNFLFGLISANVDSPATLDTTYHYDDIYIDDSWARVEIGDAPEHESCTHLEQQIPTEWSDSNVTATFNRGSFNSDSVWLYVIDENGVLSDQDESMEGAQGYELIICY